MVIDPPSHAIKCLKSDGLHSVWLIQRPGQSLRTLKSWPLGWWTLAKLAMGIAQPQRQLRGQHRLRCATILTPQSHGSWRTGRRGGRRCIELELEFAPGRSAWELISNVELHSAHGGRLIEAARRVGQTVAALSRNRIFHRDLKPSNVVIDLDSPTAPQVWIIDTVGVRRTRRRVVEIERMLERLAIQPITLEVSMARRIRMAVLRGALCGLTRRDRHHVLARLRFRTATP